MTNREAQIFQWISENPMISQEELAAKAGIKRSSVAVHISNLMKKGYIKGKGYITNEPSYCTVIGAVTLDISGTAQEKLTTGEVNQGEIKMSYGGMGRNVAHNLRMMGIGVKLITALGDDVAAHRIMERCEDLGIDLSDSLRTVNEQTATCLYVAEPQGDMSIGISNMNIYRYMTPEFMESRIEVMNRGRLTVIDTSLPDDTIELIASRSSVPLYAQPISGNRAVKLKKVLGKLHTVIPNRKEAEILSGIRISDEGSLHRAADTLLEKGIKRVFILLGEYGVYAANQEEAVLQPAIRRNIVITAGARDAFMAGLILASAKHMALREAALIGVAAADITLESREMVNPDISVEMIAARAGLEL